MEEFNVHTVIKAVTSMFSSPSSQGIVMDYKSIDTWLKLYQKSLAAWSVVGAIFNSPALPEEVYLFNAQTLKIKLMFDFEELKEIDLSAFKSNLLGYCLQFIDSSKVFKQLAQCVGILSIHLSDHWENSMITVLLQVFPNNFTALFELLKSVAQEVNNQSVVVDIEKVEQSKKRLRDEALSVFEFLENAPDEITEEIIEVFMAWAQFAQNSQILELLPNSRLLRLSFNSLKIPEKHENAAGLLCEVIRLTADQEKYGEIISLLFNFFISLKQTVITAIQNESAEGYIKMYYELGIAHIDTILKNRLMEILEFMTEVFVYKNIDSVNLLVEFWHKVYRYYRRNARNDTEELGEVLRGLMYKLLISCMKQFQLSGEELAQGVTNETEELRTQVSEIIPNISDILGIDTLLNLLCTDLTSIISAPNISDYQRCSQIEAIAFCTISLAEITEISDSLLLMSILSHLSSKIWPIPQLNLTVCSIFTAIPFALDTGKLSHVLEYLVQCIKVCPHKQIALAIKEVCRRNTDSLASHISSLSSLHSFSESLANELHEVILEGIALVLWRAEPSHIKSLCELYANRLTEDEKFLDNCDKISVIFKNGNDRNIDEMLVYEILNDIWPKLIFFLKKFEANDVHVEAICRAIKHALKKIQIIFGEYLEDFIPILIMQYQKYTQSAFLYISEQIVKIFGPSALYESLLISLFNSLISASVQQLSFQTTPEFIEDFFGMAKSYLNYCPSATLPTPGFETALIFAKSVIGIQHQSAAGCLYGFLTAAFEFCNKEGVKYDQYAGEKLLNHFSDILQNLIAAILEYTSEGIFEFIKDLMQKILNLEEGPAWLEKALLQVPHDCLVEVEKLRFVEQVQNGWNAHYWIDRLHSRAKARAMRMR